MTCLLKERIRFFALFLVLLSAIVSANFVLLRIPENTLPDLGDSVLTLFIIVWGLETFPSLPQFWPSVGGVFHQEHFLGPSLLFLIFRAFGNDLYQSFYMILTVIFAFNFIIPSLYAREWGAGIFTTLIIGFGTACFPYLINYSGHIHNWPIGCLIVLCFEGVRYFESGNYKLYPVVGALITVALFSMTMAYFSFLLLLMYLIASPKLMKQLIADCKSSYLKSASLGATVFIYLILTVYYSIYSQNSGYPLNAFANYSVTFSDIVRFATAIGHFDNLSRESDKFPMLASLMLIVAIIFGRSHLSRRTWITFFLILLVFAMLALGPYFGSVGGKSVPNPIFHLFYYLPGFGSMRVTNRFLLVVSAMSIAIGTIVWVRVASRSWMLNFSGSLFMLVSILFQVEPFLKEPVYSNIPTELIVDSAEFIDSVVDQDNPAVAHFPFSEHNYEALLYSLDKMRPTTNGVTTFFPREFWISRDMSFNCLVDDQQCDAFFKRKKDIGVGAFIIHGHLWRIYPKDAGVKSPKELVNICNEITVNLYGSPRCLLQ